MQQHLSGFIFFGFLCSCGIKGRPLPPENNVVNINQSHGSVNSGVQNSVVPDQTIEESAKIGKEVKKTNKKK